MPCCARHFGLQRNSNLTVSTYAYRFELLVLAASLTSAILSKTSFLTE